MKTYLSSADFVRIYVAESRQGENSQEASRPQFDVEASAIGYEAAQGSCQRSSTNEGCSTRAERRRKRPELVAAATAAAATTASATRKRRPLGRAAVAIRRGKHRKLDLVLLPGALRAGDLLLLVDHNLLKLSSGSLRKCIRRSACWFLGLTDPLLYQPQTQDM